MKPITVRVFVSSTKVDLQPERTAVEDLLQRFRETKFIGMEYFGSSPETTRQRSIADVDRSDLYVGIIGGRYGSGITQAEYARARARRLPCLVYFKQETAITADSKDEEPKQLERLKKFKDRLREAHTIVDFSGPQELASRLASDLHNWILGRYLSPALKAASRGSMRPDEAVAFSGDLRHFARVNRDSGAHAAKEKQRLDEWRRLVSTAYYQLTYVVPQALERFPDTAQLREEMVRENLKQLDRQFALSDGAHEVLRELATNYRLLAAILMERGRHRQALAAFRASAAHCVSLVNLQPNNALYHRDLAVSHLNVGFLLAEQRKQAAARKEYLAGLASARRAAALDPQWSNLVLDARASLRKPLP